MWLSEVSYVMIFHINFTCCILSEFILEPAFVVYVYSLSRPPTDVPFYVFLVFFNKCIAFFINSFIPSAIFFICLFIYGFISNSQQPHFPTAFYFDLQIQTSYLFYTILHFFP